MILLYDTMTTYVVSYTNIICMILVYDTFHYDQAYATCAALVLKSSYL